MRKSGRTMAFGGILLLNFIFKSLIGMALLSVVCLLGSVVFSLFMDTQR